MSRLCRPGAANQLLSPQQAADASLDNPCGFGHALKRLGLWRYRHELRRRWLHGGPCPACGDVGGEIVGEATGGFVARPECPECGKVWGLGPVDFGIVGEG